MVTTREFVEEGLTEIWGRLRELTGDLTHDQLLWRPDLAGTPGNSAGFLLWHVSRVEDNFIQRFILRGDEGWAQGWAEKFGYQTRGIGTGFSAEEAGEVNIPSAEIVWAYLDEVRKSTLAYLAALDWSTLEEKPRADRFPQWSVQTILRQLIAHPNQHLGQIDLLRGLMGLGGGLG